MTTMITVWRDWRASAMATFVVLAGIPFLLQRDWRSLLERPWKSMSFFFLASSRERL